MSKQYRYTIEFVLPCQMDPIEVLCRLQEWAVELGADAVLEAGGADPFGMSLTQISDIEESCGVREEVEDVLLPRQLDEQMIEAAAKGQTGTVVRLLVLAADWSDGMKV
jgi:hypothetical protein